MTMTNNPHIHAPGAGVQSRSIVIYGMSGRGKTTLLSTVPGKGLVIEVPQLEGSGSDVLAGFKNIEVWPVAEWKEIEEVYDFLVDRSKHDYRWVAIDTITDFVKLARRKVIGERTLAADPHKMQIQEYGSMNLLIEEMIYKFRTLSVFMFFIAQERKHEMMEGEQIIGPDVPPGVLTPLMSGALMAGRLKLEYTLDGVAERQLFLGPSPDHYTKVRTRSGIKVPKATRTLDIAKIVAYFAGKDGAVIDMVDDTTGFEIDLSELPDIPVNA